MYHIAFNCDDNYVKYTAVLMQNIISYTRDSKSFKDSKFADSNNKVDSNKTDFIKTDSNLTDSNNKIDSNTKVDSITIDSNNTNALSASKYETSTNDSIESSITPPPPVISQIMPHNSSHNTDTIKDSKAPYHFHIISDYISNDNLKRLEILESSLNAQYPCRISTHIVENIFTQFKTWGFNDDASHSVYYRILIDKILPQNVEKVLYIDTDMLVLSDIRELFSIDLKDKILASSSGYVTPTGWEVTFEPLKGGEKLVVDFKSYFCTGLMLINMPRWRAQNVESKCMDFLRDYKSDFANQDALNYAAMDSIDLESGYGILIYQYIMHCFEHYEKTKKEYESTFKNLKIIHCNGPAKAWSNFFLLAPLEIKRLVHDTWWEIAFKTAGFSDIMRNLSEKNKEDALRYCANTINTNLYAALESLNKSLNDRLNTLDKRLYPYRHPYKAIKNALRKAFSRVMKRSQIL